MKRCPITYEPSNETYSAAGLRKLSPNLRALKPLPFDAHELRREAARMATKMSIQGMQPKLSAVLRVQEGQFDIVPTGGSFILKPQTADYPQVPENEDVSMRMARAVGIEVPLHGLVYAKDGTLVYFIRRFDRVGRNRKLALEDFAQLSGGTRETKYDSSIENVIRVIDTYSTFPVVDRADLFRRILFCYLIGNEDMHLKNFSLITNESNVIKLAPAYDFLNSTIVLPSAKEELALPLKGRKRNLTKSDFLEYFAKDRLQLGQKVIDTTLKSFRFALGEWRTLIEKCFLHEALKEKYLHLLSEREKKLLESS